MSEKEPEAIELIGRTLNSDSHEAHEKLPELIIKLVKCERKKMDLYREMLLALAYHKKINTVEALHELGYYPLPGYMANMFYDWYQDGGWEKLKHRKKMSFGQGYSSEHLLSKYVKGFWHHFDKSKKTR